VAAEPFISHPPVHVWRTKQPCTAWVGT
jgi:hypothetical protein